MLVVLLGQQPSAQWRPGGIMRIVLLVDSSSTIAPMVTPIRAGLESCSWTKCRRTPRSRFISTGGQIRIRVPPTTDHTVLRDAVNRFAADGGANSFVDTLLESDQRFLRKAADRRSVFVILTTDVGFGVADVRLEAYNKFAGEFVARGGRAHAIVVRGLNSGYDDRALPRTWRTTPAGITRPSASRALFPKMMKTLSGVPRRRPVATATP